MKSPIRPPKGKDAKNDLIAGLTTGLVQIPDAMASAILAAVQPVNGLNTLIIGTPIGALFSNLAWPRSGGSRRRLLQTLWNAGVERPRLAVRFNDLLAGKRLRLCARGRFVLFGATYRAASRTG